MKDLSSRKQFLIAESELSRAQFIEEVNSLRGDLQAFAQRVHSYKAVASSAALLVTGLTTLKRGGQKDSDTKPSWLKTLLKGAGLASTVWLALQMPGRER